MKYLRSSVRMIVAGAAAVCLAACGESGSTPTLYPEIRFEVVPTAGGQVSFKVNGLVTTKTEFTFPEGTVFTTATTMSFYLLNGPPPYQGTVERVGDADVTVRVYQLPNESFTAEDSTAPGKPVAVVNLQGVPTGPFVPAAQSVRFDLCAPTGSASSCSVVGDLSESGVTRAFNGDIGDLDRTNQVNGATPAVYFFYGGKDRITGVFQAAFGLTMQAQLFVAGSLMQTVYGSGDIVIKQDL